MASPRRVPLSFSPPLLQETVWTSLWPKLLLHIIICADVWLENSRWHTTPSSWQNRLIPSNPGEASPLHSRLLDTTAHSSSDRHPKHSWAQTQWLVLPTPCLSLPSVSFLRLLPAYFIALTEQVPSGLLFPFLICELGIHSLNRHSRGWYCSRSWRPTLNKAVWRLLQSCSGGGGEFGEQGSWGDLVEEMRHWRRDIDNNNHKNSSCWCNA